MTGMPTAVTAHPPTGTRAVTSKAQTLERRLRSLIHSDISTLGWVTLRAGPLAVRLESPLGLVVWCVLLVVVMRRSSGAWNRGRRGIRCGL